MHQAKSSSVKVGQQSFVSPLSISKRGRLISIRRRSYGGTTEDTILDQPPISLAMRGADGSSYLVRVSPLDACLRTGGGWGRVPPLQDPVCVMLKTFGATTH